MASEEDAGEFSLAFTEWVEACFFGERDGAARRLDAVLRFPAEVVLTGSLSLLARLLEAFAPAGDAEVAAALAQHLVVTGPDPEREALIRDVVLAAGAPGGAALLARHPTEALAAAALECASFLTQAVANEEGVVPSSILGSL